MHTFTNIKTKLKFGLVLPDQNQKFIKLSILFLVKQIY